MGSKQTFLDGCHRYGWIINILVTVFLMGVAWGSVRAEIQSLHGAQDAFANRIERIENILLCGSVGCGVK